MRESQIWPVGVQPKIDANSGDTATEIVRTFWHGPPLDPYRLLCLWSFVSRGHSVELFAYDDVAAPDWIVRRDAQEIWPADQVLRYRSGGGIDSPALHSNLFRYALLNRFGGWWVDTDVILLQPEMPSDLFFFAREDEPYLNNAIIKFPAGHAVLADAVDYCCQTGEAAVWGQTGPRLLTRLVIEHELTSYARAADVTCPVQWWDIEALFDPSRCDEVRERSAGSTFIHLCSEMWRRAEIPTDRAPPRGSFLDELIMHLDPGIQFSGVMDFAELSTRFARTMRAELMRRVVSLEQTIEERTSRLLAVEDTLRERNSRIVSLEESLSERDLRLRAVEQTLEERNHRLTTLEQRANGGAVAAIPDFENRIPPASQSGLQSKS
jgi:Glycosyltransferase sugar-binding region containing DXD motif/Alpha 1,4-glycosyltransferase conserved region